MSMLVTLCFLGLLAMTCLAAGRWSRAGRADGGGQGRGSRPKPIPIVTGGPDVELVRILDDARFGDLRLSGRAHRQDHRPGEA